MKPTNKLAALASLLALAGCVTFPAGPSVMVLPGTGRSFDEFRADDASCKQYAYVQIGGQDAQQAQANSAAASAAIGTVLGAAAGAALGGNSQGAAAGAGVGLLAGSMIGANSGYASGYEAQRRYDIAYTQCMYAKGHRVPTTGRYAAPQSYAAQPPAPQAYTPPPPPPPGTPPPPPPY